ncbi:MAG: small multi-drug export protein [Candidatus Cloacimonetes bacterium]|nr:small multi-drug export protein [Candidatus Cloacimonadota bacterium]
MKSILVLIIIFLILGNQLAGQSLKEKITGYVNEFHLSSEIKVFMIAMIPIFELRGAIPIGITVYELPVWKVFPLAIAGNMVPIAFILLFFDVVTRFCFRIPLLQRILQAIFRRTRSKSRLIEKYEEVGLMLFVAIPLPITGAWTGSLAAYLLGLSFWKSLFFIFLGVIIAGIVVTFLTSLRWLGALIAGAALLGVIIRGIMDRQRGRA